MPTEWTYVGTGGYPLTWSTWSTTTTGSSSSISYVYPHNATWTDWNSNQLTVSGTGSVWYSDSWTGTQASHVTFYPTLTVPESGPEVQARADAALVRVKERERLAEEANERATELLRFLLSEEQWASWEKSKFFELESSEGNRYRIKHGVAGNVYLLDETGKTVESLCAHPSLYLTDERGQHVGDLPRVDVVISQLLALRGDETEFRRVANITDYRTRDAVTWNAAA